VTRWRKFEAPGWRDLESTVEIRIGGAFARGRLVFDDIGYDGVGETYPRCVVEVADGRRVPLDECEAWRFAA